uniref:ComA protein n=1 Tax=Fopius arisanus TaxID=64838 RepID=A0A0C9RT88_9HYME
MSEQWKKKGLRNAPCEPKHLTRSLALLPPNLVQLGVEVIKDVSSQYTAIFPQLNDWCEYVQNEWGNKPEILSVAGSCIRTNNDSEAFNRHFTSRAGGRQPRVFQFIRNLQDIIENEVTNVKRSNANIPMVKTKRMDRIFKKDMGIQAAHEELLLNRITKETIYQFMKDHLPEKLSKEIDDERLKISTGNITRTTFIKKRQSMIMFSSHDDEEYGVKRKRIYRRRPKEIVDGEKSNWKSSISKSAE